MRVTLTAALVASALVMAPATALAQTDEQVAEIAITDVDSAKERALAAIDQRLATIDRMRERIVSSPFVSGEHQGGLLGELGRAEAGLRGLAAEIRAAETIGELRVLIPKIATDFRIYLVVVPKVSLVLGSDAVVAAGERLSEAADVLAGWIIRAEEAGLDVTEARTHLADMQTEIAEAVRTGGPVVDAVLPLTAADWPEPASRLLADGRSHLLDARSALRRAWHSAHEVAQALREAFGAGRPA